MEIILIRYCYSRWGVMGALYIDGLCICHTCEHPLHSLPLGKYIVKKERGKLRIEDSLKKGDSNLPIFRPGNGPFAYRDGSIIVGKYRASGLLIHSQDSYTALFKRILWFHTKKESITLTIKDRKKNVYEIL